jgi:hypothetical protein
MRTVGAGAAAIGVSGMLPGTSLAQDDADEDDEEPAGYLSIIYDDSPIEDFEMFQVHEEYGAPGCAAACPGLMDSSGDWLSTGHLQEMYDAGWEVMSHTIDHRALGEVPIAEDIQEGDRQIYADTNLQGRFEGDPLMIFDEDGNEAEATVVGNGDDDTGQYIELEESISESFTAADTTVVRYTDEFTEEIVADSQAQLEEMVGEGQVTNWIYTYERADGLVGELVPEYYDATPREDGVGLNPEHDPDPYELSRRYMETDHIDEADIEQFLDTVANEPDYGVLAGHSQFDTMTTERIDFVLDQAQQRDIEVITVQEALDIFGVVEAPERATDEDGEGDGTENGDDEAEEHNGDDDTGDDESMGIFDRIVAFFRSIFS